MWIFGLPASVDISSEKWLTGLPIGLTDATGIEQYSGTASIENSSGISVSGVKKSVVQTAIAAVAAVIVTATIAVSGAAQTIENSSSVSASGKKDFSSSASIGYIHSLSATGSKIESEHHEGSGSIEQEHSFQIYCEKEAKEESVFDNSSSVQASGFKTCSSNVTISGVLQFTSAGISNKESTASFSTISKVIAQGLKIALAQPDISQNSSITSQVTVSKAGSSLIDLAEIIIAAGSQLERKFGTAEFILIADVQEAGYKNARAGLIISATHSSIETATKEGQGSSQIVVCQSSIMNYASARRGLAEIVEAVISQASEIKNAQAACLFENVADINITAVINAIRYFVRTKTALSINVPFATSVIPVAQLKVDSTKVVQLEVDTISSNMSDSVNTNAQFDKKKVNIRSSGEVNCSVDISATGEKS